MVVLGELVELSEERQETANLQLLRVVPPGTGHRRVRLARHLGIERRSSEAKTKRAGTPTQARRNLRCRISGRCGKPVTSFGCVVQELEMPEAQGAKARHMGAMALIAPEP